MKIRRTRRVNDQIALAIGLKRELIRLIRGKVRRSASDQVAEGWRELLRHIELSAPAFKVITKTKSAAQVNRRASMLTGPFYTSAAFPLPMDTVGGCMFPILQLELNEASAAIQQPLGDGLLQLWYDLADAKELIRVVPLLSAYDCEPTPFDWVAPPNCDDGPWPVGWNLDPCGAAVQEITEVVAAGFECQAGWIEACYDELEPDPTDWLGILLKLFIEKAPFKPADSGRSVKLFGSFFGIQYSAADVNLPCLMSMGWQASGGAELFYDLSKSEASRFAFWSCGR